MLSISSLNVEPEFRIFVALPHRYANSGKAYPVLYHGYRDRSLSGDTKGNT
ncbi:hypothetical protein [Microseira sp. BLCC-F43]|uniref:hypothetical protein n=1 Tax=Microseira sp. BLCC-F43 TaxID=3153602 RepID=UPI0035B9E4B8